MIDTRVCTADRLGPSPSRAQNSAYRPTIFIDNRDHKQHIIVAQQSFIQRVLFFLRYGVWRKTGQNLTRREFLGYKVLKTILLSIRGFREDKVLVRADALAYALLFSTVPIIALMFAISKGFGFEEVLKEQLQSIPILQQINLIPTLMDFVQRYLDTAQGGVFIGVGFIMLLWSIYYFFNSVETSFNEIWSVHKSRNILRQLSMYVIIVIAIPVLIICSYGISIFVNSNLPDTAFFATMAPVKDFLMRLVPFVLAWLFYSWMYWAIPNTKVGAAAAFIPGIFIGTLFQLLQMLSVWIIAFLGRYSIVYGAFAAVPLILFWLEWVSVLTFYGAEISYAIQNNEYFDYQADMEQMSRRYKDYITLYVVYLIVKNFQQGDKPLSTHAIAQAHHLPISMVNNLVGRLVETEVLREIFVEGDEDKTFVPAIDINQLTVEKVFHVIDKQGSELFIESPTKDMKQFWTRWLELKETPETMRTLLVKDIIQE